MVQDFDELGARREAFRKVNGRFGDIPVSEPEVSLHDGSVPGALERLAPVTDEARGQMSKAIVEMIDASMPDEAVFVNYVLAADSSQLSVGEAIGEYGEELEPLQFVHIDNALLDLGQPYFDFDGDLVMNSQEDFGWERTEPYSADTDREARRARDVAKQRWQRAIEAEQRVVIEAIWPLVDPAVEALDFSWDSYSKSLKLAAAIRPSGRMRVDDGKWQECDTLASYIKHPEHTPMQLNELSGLYRLSRPA